MPFLKYNFWRLITFLVAWAALWLWWGDAWLSAFAAIVVSGVVSYFLLRKQREAWVASIQQRADRAVERSRANHAVETEPDERDHFDEEPTNDPADEDEHQQR